jgi:hypothetical protein
MPLTTCPTLSGGRSSSRFWAGNYTYFEATGTQGLTDWIGAHMRAFEYPEGRTDDAFALARELRRQYSDDAELKSLEANAQYDHDLKLLAKQDYRRFAQPCRSGVLRLLARRKCGMTRISFRQAIETSLHRKSDQFWSSGSTTNRSGDIWTCSVETGSASISAAT